MKTSALFTLLIIAAAGFVAGCSGTPLGGEQEISGWPLKIGGDYESLIYTGKTEFPGKTVFKTEDGKLSGGYELTAGGDKVTGTLSDFKAVGKNTLKCRWKDINGVGNFTMVFADDMSSFKGNWDSDGKGGAGAWNGKK